MKKLYSLFAVAAMSLAVNAQSNLFAGSDFNDWAAFESSLGFDLKFAEQSTNGGVGGTGALKIVNNSTTKNDYVMTANKNMNVTGVKYITLKMKGVSGGISFNAGDGTQQGSKFFNVPAGTTGDITLTPSTQNSYTGSINATDWITVRLDVTDVNWGETPTFSIKLQKSSTNALFVDDIKGSATLAVADFAQVNSTLVKNTSVSSELIFGAKSDDVKVLNLNGQVVKTFTAVDNGRVNVSSLPKGVYIVTGTVNGKAVSQKIIKK